MLESLARRKRFGFLYRKRALNLPQTAMIPCSRELKQINQCVTLIWGPSGESMTLMSLDTMHVPGFTKIRNGFGKFESYETPCLIGEFQEKKRHLLDV